LKRLFKIWSTHMYCIFGKFCFENITKTSKNIRNFRFVRDYCKLSSFSKFYILYNFPETFRFFQSKYFGLLEAKSWTFQNFQKINSLFWKQLLKNVFVIKKTEKSMLEITKSNIFGVKLKILTKKIRIGIFFFCDIFAKIEIFSFFWKLHKIKRLRNVDQRLSISGRKRSKILIFTLLTKNYFFWVKNSWKGRFGKKFSAFLNFQKCLIIIIFVIFGICLNFWIFSPNFSIFFWIFASRNFCYFCLNFRIFVSRNYRFFA